MGYYPEFAEQLNTYLHSQDRTASWLAHRLAIHPGTVGRWLNQGTRPGSPELIVRIADLLGIHAPEERQGLLIAAGYGYQEKSEPKPESTLSVSEPSSLSLDKSSHHNLPAQTTPFIGRLPEQQKLIELVKSGPTRLITVLGPGGIGKTRLALAVAEHCIPHFTHGVYLIDLAPLDTAAAIISAVGEATQYPFQVDNRLPKQQILDYLSSKQILLVFDNFEHLLEGTDLITEILHCGPQVTVLVTSRERLNLQSETLFPLEGLEIPDTATPESQQTSAIQLFLQTARRSYPHFAPTETDWDAIVEICQLVQGMPLGLILAATWIETLSPPEIATEIKGSIDFLETNLRDIPARQQSLRAIFDGSWQWLNPEEQRVFSQLSVFRGSFTQQAAQTVIHTSLRTLTGLVHKSLLQRHSTNRFYLHELLRQFGVEVLAQQKENKQATLTQYSAYYLSFLQNSEILLKGSQQSQILADIEADHENCRVAWAWHIENTMTGPSPQTVNGLGLFYEIQGRYQDGLELFKDAATSLRASDVQDIPLILPLILGWQAKFAYLLGQIDVAKTQCQKAFQLLDRPEFAHQDTRADLAFLWSVLGDATEPDQAQPLQERSLALYRSLDDDWNAARLLKRSGQWPMQLQNKEQTQENLEESVVILRQLADQRSLKEALFWLSWVYMMDGVVEQAEVLMMEIDTIGQYTNQPTSADVGLFGLGCLYNGQFEKGIDLIERGRSRAQELGIQSNIAYGNVCISIAKLHLGQYDQAKILSQEALTQFQTLEQSWGEGISKMTLGQIDLVQQKPEQAYQSLTDAIKILRQSGPEFYFYDALVFLGLAACHLNLLSEADRLLTEALQIIADAHPSVAHISVIPAIAVLFMRQGKKERANDLYQFALQYPYVADSRWFKQIIEADLTQIPHTSSFDQAATSKTSTDTMALTSLAKVLLNI